MNSDMDPHTSRLYLHNTYTNTQWSSRVGLTIGRLWVRCLLVLTATGFLVNRKTG